MSTNNIVTAVQLISVHLASPGLEPTDDPKDNNRMIVFLLIEIKSHSLWVKIIFTKSSP